MFVNTQTELKPNSNTMAMLRVGLMRIKETKSNKRPLSVANLSGSKLIYSKFCLNIELNFQILI